MLIHVTTDNNITASQELVGWVEATLTQAFSRFEPQLMRIEVRLADENSHKEGKNDKRCILEARLSGLEPIVAGENGATLEQALDGAADHLLRAVENRLERLEDASRQISMSGKPGA